MQFIYSFSSSSSSHSSLWQIMFVQYSPHPIINAVFTHTPPTL